jgi:uncharacterized protein (DUF1778 family)
MPGRQRPRREYRIDMRVTEEEARIFRQHAESEGSTLSAWLRRLARYEARNALRRLETGKVRR